MEIILRKEFENLGVAGDTVNVKPGYARNYLFPLGVAFPATEANKRRVEDEKKKATFRLNKEKVVADGLKKKLENVSCTIKVAAGEEDKLFGSVTNQNIADALAEQEITIDRRKIQLEEPIKALGIYSIPIKLHPEVIATVKVWVVKE
jgi:large subunit ribosomal protein L9